MSTWFISDLHLQVKQPAIQHLFVEFLHALPANTQALYILGDFVEYWVGDDMLSSDFGHFLQPSIQLLKKLVDKGVPVYLQRGNRDFLIGEQFTSATGIELLPDLALIDLYHTPTLLLHGDLLCTDDSAYQQARQLLRNPQWQEQFLSQPLTARIAQAEQMRMQSRLSMQTKDEAILDVNPEAVSTLFRQMGVTRMIHGHTHRPAMHIVNLGNTSGLRVVLGDWHTTKASFLCANADGLSLTY